MTKYEIYYMGLLANIDSSILKMNIGNGFKIEFKNEDEIIERLSEFENISYFEMIWKTIVELNCFNTNDKGIYYITNSYECDIEEYNNIDKKLFDEVNKYRENYIMKYLNPKIRLMRLFKEGNICVSLNYYYIIDQNTPQLLMRTSPFPRITDRSPFSLNNDEVIILRNFIESITIPFNQNYLQLAFENFELSYNIENINLSFLSLMIGMEALFNRGQPELSQTISRNTAVLLGKDKEDSKIIFQEMMSLYNKRSAIVHCRKSNIINDNDLLKLRFYLRECIKEIFKMDMNKDEVFHILNSSGFGERLWRK